jgi:ribosomal protein S18 acetylase RimI-like enzyme
MNDIVADASLTFRAAATADVAAIVALVESAYRGDSGRRGWTTESDLLDGQRTDPESVAAVIAKAGNRVLLAHRHGVLLACAHIEKQGDASYFGMFAVNPDLQGGGVGKQMMSEAERIARDEYKCKQMEMTVISVRNDLIAWYERRGYRRTGVFKPFPYGDERFGIPKRDDLRFELLVKTL